MIPESCFRKINLEKKNVNQKNVKINDVSKKNDTITLRLAHFQA